MEDVIVEIDAWLRRIDLSQSAELFHSNDIDAEPAGRNERQQAHDLLAPVHDWFTEGSTRRTSRKPRR